MASPLRITYGQASHVGLKRSENQDACGKFPRNHDDLSEEREHLFVVADGMGGHLGGREASRMAVEAIEEVYFSNLSGPPGKRLRQAVEAANSQVFSRASREADLYGMGTTCTAMVLRDHTGWIAHVGDSRVYRITPGGIEQLTVDHTRVEEMVRQQLLTREEAAVHPQRNVLQRALGVDPEVEVDLIEDIPLQPGEHYLLCSDGLAYVSEQEIRETVLAHAPQAACDRLVELANAEGGHDNVTVLIVQLEGAPGERRFRWGRRLFSR